MDDDKRRCDHCVYFNPVEYICEETVQPKDGDEKPCRRFYSWEQCEKDNEGLI